MMTVTDFYFPSSDGENRIRARRWQDDEREPVGLLQISHGIIEHIERYDDFARYMAAKGFIVFGNDHLGHGKSVKADYDLGFFGAEDGWEHIVDDVHQLHDIMNGEYPQLPYFILGHSMGSFILRTYLIRYPEDRLTGALISGTGQQPKIVLLGGVILAKLECWRLGSRGISRIANNLSLNSYNKFFEPSRTPHDWLSRDEEQVDRNLADPLCNFDPSVSALLEMLRGIRFIGSVKNARKMRHDLPVFFFSGDKDPVGEQGKGVRRAVAVFKKAGMKDVKLKLYPEGRHEMLNELNRGEVYGDVSAWIEEKM